MAKIHAFDCDDDGRYRLVIHTAMPTGNNSVGSTWKSVWLAAGRASTLMTEGTGIGQISAAEKASVLAGDLIEINAHVPTEVVSQGAAAVNAYVDKLISQVLEKLSRQLAYYGWTNG